MSSEVFTPICIQNKEAVQLCCNIDCKTNCFMCHDIQCSCSSNHQQCEKLNWSYFKKKIDSNIAKNTKQFKIIEEEVQSCYQNMTNLLRKTYKDFIQWKDNFGFTQKEKEFITLTKQKKFDQITGQKIHFIALQLKNKSKIIFGGQMQMKKQLQNIYNGFSLIVTKISNLYNYVEFTRQNIQDKQNKTESFIQQIQQLQYQQQYNLDYKYNVRKAIDESASESLQFINIGIKEQTNKIVKVQQRLNQKIKNLQNQLYGIREQVQKDREKLNKSMKQLRQIDQLLSPQMDISIVMKPQFTINLLQSKSQINYHFKIDSKIITKIDKLSGFFKEKSIKNIDLLYRASQHKYSILKFHELCDKIPNTIIIVKTEFGKIIGGYTPIAWDSHKHNQWESDPNLSTFLFSITQNSRIELTNQFKSILQRNDYGPIFGSGASLLIADRCNEFKNSHCAGIGSGFKNELFNKNNQESKEKFSGQNKGHTFIIQEWEVFKIKFNETIKL